VLRKAVFFTNCSPPPSSVKPWLQAFTKPPRDFLREPAQ